MSSPFVSAQDFAQALSDFRSLSGSAKNNRSFQSNSNNNAKGDEMKTIGMLLCVSLFAMLTSNARASECQEGVSVKEVRSAVMAGEQAFTSMDLDALREQYTRVFDELLPCLNERLNQEEAAMIHRLAALEAFTRSQETEVIRAFQRVRSNDPSYTLPYAIAPEEHPLRVLFNQAVGILSEDATLIPTPINGYVVVDGARRSKRPDNLPVIIQGISSRTDQVIRSRYVRPGDPMPTWPDHTIIRPDETDEDDDGAGTDTPPVIKPTGWRNARKWWIATGVTTALAAAFYVPAMINKARFNNKKLDAQSEEDLDGLEGYRRRANGFGAVALALTGASVIEGGFALGLTIKFGGDDENENTDIETRKRVEVTHEGG